MGGFLFAGRVGAVGNDELRRALVRFDVAQSLPAQATIQSASLRLVVSKTIAPAVVGTLHRVQADWSEGDSVSGERGGGMGAGAGPGDVTWLHTDFDTAFWSAAGGDFQAGASASALFGSADDEVVFTGIALRDDVQDMLDAPASDFGWIVLGGEAGGTSARRLFSRETASAADRPVLIVSYVPEPGAPAALLALLVGLALAWRRARAAPGTRCQRCAILASGVR